MYANVGSTATVSGSVVEPRAAQPTGDGPVSPRKGPTMYDVSTVPALNRIPDKALRFIVALGRLPQARQALEAAGMTPAHVREGLSLLQAASGAGDDDDAAARESRRSEASRRLSVEGPLFVSRTERVLRRQLPDIANEVFAGLDAGSPALRTVGAVLDRLEALAADPRPLAAVALLLLETRGLGTALRRALASQVRCAEGDPAALADDDREPQRAARTEAAVALYRWYQTWSMAARIAVPDAAALAALGVVAPARTETRPQTPRTGLRAA